VVDDIKSSLERSRINKAIVFTDGSTSPMNKFPNSGCGIFITDEKNKPVWSGGMVVRTDGNNFIAELAAAAIIVKAVPPNLPLLLRIDSMAAIGAITKGPVSERKRIRAAGRAWLNFSRSEFFAKMKTINVEHVSSHTRNKLEMIPRIVWQTNFVSRGNHHNQLLTSGRQRKLSFFNMAMSVYRVIPVVI